MSKFNYQYFDDFIDDIVIDEMKKLIKRERAFAKQYKIPKTPLLLAAKKILEIYTQ